MDSKVQSEMDIFFSGSNMDSSITDLSSSFCVALCIADVPKAKAKASPGLVLKKPAASPEKGAGPKKKLKAEPSHDTMSKEEFFNKLVTKMLAYKNWFTKSEAIKKLKKLMRNGINLMKTIAALKKSHEVEAEDS